MIGKQVFIKRGRKVALFAVFTALLGLVSWATDVDVMKLAGRFTDATEDAIGADAGP